MFSSKFVFENTFDDTKERIVQACDFKFAASWSSASQQNLFSPGA